MLLLLLLLQAAALGAAAVKISGSLPGPLPLPDCPPPDGLHLSPSHLQDAEAPAGICPLTAGCAVLGAGSERPVQARVVAPCSVLLRHVDALVEMLAHLIEQVAGAVHPHPLTNPRPEIASWVADPCQQSRHGVAMLQKVLPGR